MNAQDPSGHRPGVRDPDQIPEGQPVQNSSTLGFFNNSLIGQLGSVNRVIASCILGEVCI